ncbi:MAG: 3-hexulose-6-phosphate synthase [Lachnospiraceae bacterium]|nr:3-hexulose-6-phosphate synthase [Lachnospiraceae bacterium]
MKLQLALDEMNLVDALRFTDKVAEYIDIIEIGTPFVMDEGMRGVREFKRFFPDKEVLADLKIMDGGYLEASYAFEAGASYATVCGAADTLTIQGAVKAANDYGKKAVVDMITITDLPKRVAEMEAIGAHILAVHTGADAQQVGREPIEDLRVMKGCAKTAQIAVAGGISSQSIDKYVALKPEIVIVGSAIGHAKNPVAEAKAIKEALL